MLGDDIYSIKEIGNRNKIVIKANERDISKTKIIFDRDSFNNLLILDKDVNIFKSIINFKGSNSTIYLNASKKNYEFIIRIYNNSLLYIGKNCFFNSFDNSKTVFFVYEHQNIIIGDNCLISYNVQFRTSDVHVIYDMDSHKRINPAKSILIGDHVWIGQDSLILKGTKVGSGSIIGAKSIVSGKKIPSNQIWAGNPAHFIKKNIFWERPGTNRVATDLECEKYNTCDDKRYIYTDGGSSLVDSIDTITVEQLLIRSHNRFAVLD